VTDHPLPDIRPDVPHGARIWNYWLGGKDNYAADREIGDAVSAVFPELVEPGIVPLTQWRPENVEVGQIEHIDAYCGVGRKP
jgi:hypothetical protein